jgi:DNA-binding GntR family transcriptional regulator
MSFPPDTDLGYVNKRDLVAAFIRESISREEFVRGQRLRQQQLAQQLGVSPTPIREALRLLESQGLVVYEPNKGVRVASISVKDVEEVYALRRILESYATMLAVANLTADELQRLETLQLEMEELKSAGKLRPLQKLNDEFHAILYNAANNRRLHQMITNLWGQYRGDSLWLISEVAEQFIRDHRSILAAVRSGEGKLAGERQDQHIARAGEYVIKHIRQQGNIPR